MGGDTVRQLAAARDGPLRQNLRPLAAWLADASLTDLCINEPGVVWLARADGWTRVAAPLLTMAALRDLVQLIATYSGHICDEGSPMLSGTLPDGERVQVVMPPAVAPDKMSITIRKPSQALITPAQYEVRGFHDEVPDYSLEHIPPDRLRAMQRVDRELLELRAAREYWKFYELAVRENRNIVIAGATGSGKTTLLKTLVNFIPLHERIITIEDTPEIHTAHPNTTHLFYGAERSAMQCLKACLRMYPSRILPGELRDEAAYDFIQTVTSGHPGALTTIHGGSVWGAFSRLASLVAQCDAGRAMASSGGLEQVLRSQIHIVLVVVARDEFDQPGGRGRKLRRVVEIGCNADPGFRERI